MEDKKILIATDGSSAGTAAVEAGLEVAAAMRSAVRFLHAFSPLAEELYAEYPSEGAPLQRILGADEVLAKAVERAEQRGVSAEVELVANADGNDLGATIAGIAAGIGASMIVVGLRGPRAVAGFVLGSVSKNVLKYATVPVLVAHAPEERQAEPGD